ncbi:unnamed protein product [Caenorhabditis angaria]|uniref:Fungal lipase-type domain-containing protein n=1 Tax=Caenorhabditis angaria TaxID=860376 RepID=A0A9P1MVF6_9PELO|nr:unnamed protein product [Caenorhabditis angaria]
MITFFCIFIFLHTVIGKPEFSENFARNDMYPLASAAYSDKPNECLKNKFKNATLKNQYIIPNCASIITDNCSGFTAVLHNKKAIVISFRGTQSSLQLLAETVSALFVDQSPWPMGGKVSLYFNNAFASIWENGMENDVKELTKKYPKYEVWITGHSLGGSLASLSASYIVGSKIVASKQVKVITFGEPRTGDSIYATMHDEMVPYNFRIVHNRDPITRLPKSEYYHTNFEVHYNSDMTEYEICGFLSSWECSRPRVNIFDHLEYFDKQVADWGKMGSAAAYSENPNICLQNQFKNATLKRQYRVEKCALLLNDSCFGFSAILHDKKAIVLSFRGTESLKQFFAEIVGMIKTDWKIGGKVSRYFACAFKKIWESGMENDVEDMIKMYPDFDIWITGHSLGGAISALASSFISGKKIIEKNRIKHINFGQPRVGDEDYVKIHNELVPYSFRITHRYDIVTKLPKIEYFHTNYEVYYKNGMQNGAEYKICEGDECSSIRTSYADHKTYFEKQISKWGIDGCIE